MKTVTISAQRALPATPDRVYAFLADYHEQHPSILPPAFSNFHVEEGGIGHGTVISYDITLAGRRFSTRQQVEEPAPGRTPKEFDPLTGASTTFDVVPSSTGSQITVTTQYQSANGLKGLFERLVAPRMIRRVIDEELELLSAAV